MRTGLHRLEVGARAGRGARLALGALLAVGTVMGGCGGARGLRGSVYEGGEARFRVGPRGAGWQPLTIDDQNDLAWHDAAHDAIVQVNATCDPGADVPLTALTNHLLAGFTAREIVAQELVSLDGREALRTHATARLDGVPRELLFLVLKKDGCVYDLALVTPTGDAFERARAGFDAFVAGFGTEPSGR